MIAAIGRWRQIAVAALAIFCALTWLMLYQERAAHAETKERHAQELAAANSIKAAESERLRKIEQEMANAINTNAKAQRELSIERSARATDARAADVRLRDAAELFASNAGTSGQNSTSSDDKLAAGESGDLLAKLLDRVARRATDLAEFADQSHDSASACARDYERTTSLGD